MTCQIVHLGKFSSHYIGFRLKFSETRHQLHAHQTRLSLVMLQPGKQIVAGPVHRGNLSDYLLFAQYPIIEKRLIRLSITFEDIGGNRSQRFAMLRLGQVIEAVARGFGVLIGALSGLF